MKGCDGVRVCSGNKKRWRYTIKRDATIIAFCGTYCVLRHSSHYAVVTYKTRSKQLLRSTLCDRYRVPQQLPRRRPLLPLQQPSIASSSSSLEVDRWTGDARDGDADGVGDGRAPRGEPSERGDDGGSSTSSWLERHGCVRSEPRRDTLVTFLQRLFIFSEKSVSLNLPNTQILL